MEHAEDVRRDVASTCDRSFDLVSILEKIGLGSILYIARKMICFRNRSFKIDLGQTAPPKMTTMTLT